jgi:riboflavin transporter FmnP
MEEDPCIFAVICPECMLRAYYFEVIAMKSLWTQISENLSFVLVAAAIVAAIYLLARGSEHYLKGKRKVSPARRVSIIGICAAIATVLHVLDFPLVFLAPDFYKLDFSELPVLLCGFFLGPSASVACEGVKILLKLLVKGTSTAFVGDFANFVVGCSFVLPAIIWYHAHKSRHSAVIGLILGTLTMTVLGTAFNAIYLLPKFAQLYGISLDAIIGLGSIIHASVEGVISFVILCVAPLNLVKGVSVSVLTMLLYKRVARPLFGIKK